jgi:hypothetical protein
MFSMNKAPTTYTELVELDANLLSPQLQKAQEQKVLRSERIILVRIGDFYEAYSADARILSRELELVLTRRMIGACVVQMTGIPYHALDRHCNQLLLSGLKLVIIESDGSTKLKGNEDEWLTPEEACRRLSLDISPSTLSSYPNRSTHRISTQERFAKVGLVFDHERWSRGENYLRIKSTDPIELAKKSDARRGELKTGGLAQSADVAALPELSTSLEQTEDTLDAKSTTDQPGSVYLENVVQLELPLFSKDSDGKSANITSYSHTQIVLLVEEWQSEAYGVPSYQRCEYLGATDHRVKIRLETGQVSPVSKRRAVRIPGEKEWTRWVELVERHAQLIREYKEAVAALKSYERAMAEQLSLGKKKKQIPNPLTQWVVVGEPVSSHKTNYFAWHIPHCERRYALKHSEKLVALGCRDEPGTEICGRSPHDQTFLIQEESEWERVGNAHVQCINSKREIGHFVDIELNHYELSGYRLFG